MTTNETSSLGGLERPLWPLVFMGADFIGFFAVVAFGFYSSSKISTQELENSETIMEDTNADSTTVDPTKKELPKAARETLKRPAIAYPTIVLLILAWSLYIASFAGFLTDTTTWWQSMMMSTVAVYWNFTVMHDAVHMAIAPRKRWLNDFCGTMGGLTLFAPFSLFKYIHLSHHRHSGDDDLDPDAYAGHGPEALLPFKWFTILHHYLYYFTKTLRVRSSLNISAETKAKDRRLALSAMIFLIVVITAVSSMYWILPASKASAVVFCIMLPEHLAVMWLCYLFDYIPHRPHIIPYKEDPFKSTNATSLLGSVDNFFWNWAALGQQLHVVHHIWPFMPFYTYKDIWAVHGEEIVSKGTRVVPLFLSGQRQDYFEEMKANQDTKKTE